MTTPQYCTRTPKPRDCAGCSLVNYGLDCVNNHLPRKHTPNGKRERALAEYNGHKGMATIAHVEHNIESAYPTAYRDLTGVQYGRLMSVANTSYHDGRASAGAEVKADCLDLQDCPLLPLALLRSIRTYKRTEYTYREVAGIVASLLSDRYDAAGTPNPKGDYYRETWHITEYCIGGAVIYIERV